MPLRLRRSQVEAIRRHGERAWPHECCGLLLGDRAAEGRTVAAVVPLRNANTDSPENRFEFDPREHLAAQRAAQAQGLDTVGYYHSHPDHPARPSQFDLDHATWPGYSYYIVSIRRPGASGAAAEEAEANSYELAEDRSHFVQEEIEVLPDE